MDGEHIPCISNPYLESMVNEMSKKYPSAIPCPKCEKNACIGHMLCHHCGYYLRYEDLKTYEDKLLELMTPVIEG